MFVCSFQYFRDIYIIHLSQVNTLLISIVPYSTIIVINFLLEKIPDVGRSQEDVIILVTTRVTS